MIRYLCIILLVLASGAVHADVLSSFDEGEMITYTFTDDTEQEATITFPTNGCVESFELLATPSELVDAGALPVDAVLITDVSGSMAWDLEGRSGSSDPSRLSIAQEASEALINNFIGSGLDNRLALVSYSTDSRLDRGFSNDADALKATVNGYQANGWTCISCGVASALRELENGREDAVKVIFLMTDGEANRIIESQSENDYVYRSESASQSAAEQGTWDLVCDPDNGAVSLDYVTHTIAFSSGAGVAFLETVAGCEGNEGSAYRGITREELIEIYEELSKIETRSSPTPQMRLAGAQVLSTDSRAQDPIVVDGSCDGCEDPLLAVQRELYECYADQQSCVIPAETWSTTSGIVTLSDLNVVFETSGITATSDGFVCTQTPSCGDGELDSGEECEPAGTATCDENCLLIGSPPAGTVCGNDIHETGEQCDDGSSNLPPDFDCGLAPGARCSFCTTECMEADQFEPGDADTFVCGNGLPEPGEECDVGVRNGVSCTPGSVECEWCTDTSHPLGGCRVVTEYPDDVPPPGCGDGTIDPASGETCDPPQAACIPDYGDTCEYCSNVCTLSEESGGSCGDGLWQQEHESCDPNFGLHIGACDDACEWDGTEPPIVIDPETGDPYISRVEIELSTRRYFPPIDLSDYVDFDDVFGSDPDVEWSIVEDGGLSGSDVPSIILMNGRFGVSDVFETPDVFEPAFHVVDPAGNSVVLAFTLTVIDSIGMPPPEPDTRLMITKGTRTSGFFEEDLTGETKTWGPYTLDVRVWQR